MKTIKEILNRKGNQVWTISSGATIFEALQIMAEKEIGALLVMEEENLAGIISERDYARKVILKDKSSKDEPVSEIMSRKVMYVDINRSVDECMALMINKRIRHLPVYEKDNLAGIISIGDVVKAVIDEKEFVIDQLVHYIKDTPPIAEASDEAKTEAPPSFG
jgi:CBS domain-containing protein